MPEYSSPDVVWLRKLGHTIAVAYIRCVVILEVAGYWEPNFVRAIALLTGLCFAASAAAQTGIRDDAPQPVPALESVNQSEPPAVPATAPPSAVPTEPKYKVAKELADKVQDFAGRKEFAKAIALITETLTTDSGNAELYRLRATIQCRSANMKLCLEDADKAVETDKEYAPAYLFRGLARIDAGKPKEALLDCEATIRIWVERPLGYNCRGLANRALRDFPRAIADFDEAIIRDGKFALAHYNKGVTYTLENKPDEAIASFSSAIAINDKLDDSYAQRGKVRIGKGDVAGARGDFAKALSLNGRNFTAAVGIEAFQVGKALDALAGKN
jgi:tetratricopeptide (TPR) repeat protein